MSLLSLVLYLAVFILLFSLSAFFSASETALLSLSPMQIQRIKEKDADIGRRLVLLLNRPETLLSTLLIGNTFVNAALATVGFAFVSALGPVPERWTEATSILSVTLLVLLFGEISPKQYAIRNAEKMVPFMVRAFAICIPLLYPLSWALSRLLRPFRKSFSPERRSVSDDELVSVVNMGEESGDIDREEGAMVRGILRLNDLNASDVMTPRVDLIGLDINDPPEIHERMMREAPFVWMPLWDDTADNFIDFVDVSKYLLDPRHSLEDARCHCRTAVPENIGLDDLIILLCRQHLPVVLVTDEYGGTAGIVSQGDVLEFLSLETEDDHSAEPPDIIVRGPNRWIVAGDAGLEQINFTLGTHLDADDSDRMSGWITFHAGKIPRVGDIIEADGYRVTVQKMRRRKIIAVLLEDLDPGSRDSDLPGAAPDCDPEPEEHNAARSAAETAEEGEARI